MAKLLNLTSYWSSVLAGVCLVLALIAAPIGEIKADPPGSTLCAGAAPPAPAAGSSGSALAPIQAFYALFTTQCNNCGGTLQLPPSPPLPTDPTYPAWVTQYNNFVTEYNTNPRCAREPHACYEPGYGDCIGFLDPQTCNRKPCANDDRCECNWRKPNPSKPEACYCKVKL
jgi:hypothetical protein